MRSITALIASIFLSIVFTSHSNAQSLNPQVVILSPANGRPVFDNSLFYDSSQQTVRVSGIFADVSEALLLDGVIISVNGTLSPANFNFTDTKVVDGVTYKSGTFYQDVNFPSDSVWPIRKIFAEIVDTKTYEAYARHQVAVHDLREASNANPDEPISTEIIGMSSQLTDRGLGHRAGEDIEINLEKTQRAILPQASLSQFNSRLTSNSRQIPTHSRGPGIEACEKITKVKQEKFADERQFTPLKNILKRATNKYREYKLAKALCDKLPNPGAIAVCRGLAEAKYCIKSKPEANDFKLCVDQIDGKVRSHEISKVSYQGFNFEDSESDAHGIIKSHVTLDNSVGLIDAKLKKLYVKWKKDSCNDVDDEPVPNSLIKSTNWLSNWTLCEDVVVKDASASTLLGDLSSTLKVKTDLQDAEKPKVTMTDLGTLSHLNPSINADKGACKESFINPEVVSLANSYYSDFRQSLQNIWYANAPESMEAVAFNKVLSEYSLGSISHKNYDLFAALGYITSKPHSGLSLRWQNNLVTSHEKTLSNQNQQWFYVPKRVEVFSEDGKDFYGNRFDISYTITTGLVNKILNMRSATPQGINFIYKPTWKDLADFNIQKPSSASLDDVAVLDKKTLSKFDIAFSNIGNKKLIIEIKPTFDPYIFMPTDLRASFEIPNVGAPTAYGIDSLDITFKEKDRTSNGNKVPGKVWIKFRGGFVDKEFFFSISNNKKAQFLKPKMVRDNWSFNIYQKPNILCRMNFGGSIPGPSRCEDRIEQKVKKLIKNALKPIFIEMVSKIPAPQLFDANAESKKEFNFIQRSVRQEDQNITFYGNLD